MINVISNGLNLAHRYAILKAVSDLNSSQQCRDDCVIVIGTKNLLRGIYPVYASRKSIIYLTGFGRLYTEYSIFGRAIFFLILLFYKFKNNLAFIVENNDDAKIIKHLFASKNVLVTRSSGLQQEGFKPNKHRRNNNDIVFGYIARFDKSKRSQSIVDIAAQLPINYKLHVAGVDIKGDQYSEQFRAIAKKKPNVQYFGYLNSKRKLSNFYNSVDTILYPTSREGLPMTLLEAAIHKTDFIASDVAGCRELATEFGRELWNPDEFNLSNLLKHKPKKITASHQKQIKKYLSTQVEATFCNFLTKNFINKISVFDISNTNEYHRYALLQAIEKINLRSIRNGIELIFVVSTRNMIRVLPLVIFSRMETIINIVGFGRLYTEYGIVGRKIFNFLVWFHDRTTARAFIVEHEADRAILRRIARKPVYATHGSGLNVADFSRKRPHKSKTLRLGYLSRFHNSKGSHEILKAAKNLPSDRELVIAGWDIKGNKYSEAFRQISENKSNVRFLGRLDSRQEVSKFFNSIDLFLSPSVREGGNIALQEAIWHGVPFLTTNVPGCAVLAEIFGCPAIRMKDFGSKILDYDLRTLTIDTSNWNKKITPFLSKNVEKEYFAFLSEVIKKHDK